jgi:hypothetical protein
MPAIHDFGSTHAAEPWMAGMCHGCPVRSKEAAAARPLFEMGGHDPPIAKDSESSV